MTTFQDLQKRAPSASLVLFLLATLSACGQAERADDRTRGADDITVRPQKVQDSGDANPADGDGDAGQDDGSADGEADAGDDEAANDGTSVQGVFTAAGLRNFEQINATMATVTGVPMTTPAVRDLFQGQLATSLPTDNDVKAFLGSHQVAVFKLAVQYCESLVADPTLRGAVFGTFNFAGAPATALNATGKTALADALVTRFWGKDLESLPPHAESVDMVEALVDSLLVGKNMNTVTVTPVVVTGVCTAVLASAPVTMF